MSEPKGERTAQSIREDESKKKKEDRSEEIKRG